MTAVVDDYAAIAARLRTLGGSRTEAAAAMPTRALHRQTAEPGIIPPDPSSGTPPAGNATSGKTQPGASTGNADPDWSYCFWFAPA